jgi:hypothetical protein
MVGMRGLLLASVVLVGVGAMASASSGTAASGRPTASAPVADRAVSQIAPPLSAAKSAAQATAPLVATPQPAGPAQPDWKIVPTSSLAIGGSSSSGQPFFKGGVHSKVGPSSSAPVGPRLVTPSGPVLYNGLKAVGETAALAGNVGGTPPDSTGSIGPNDYVEIVNSSIADYDRNLVLKSRATLANLINFGGSLCDPQVQWDPAANRWLFVVLACNNNPGAQGFLVGWSRTADPSTLSPAGWCSYGIQTNPNLFDYPKLGHNSNYLIVGGNFYDESFANPPFVSAAIAWFPLPANSDASCGPTSLHHSGALVDGDGTTLAFTPVPVNTISSATDGYVVSAYDPAGNNNVAPGARNKLAVWHLDSAGVLHPDADLSVTTYNAPLSAPQLGGTTHFLDTLDGRLTQAVGDPVTGMWTQHTVNGPGGRSEVDWYEITVSGSTPTIAQLGVISNGTDWVFNAAISPRFDAQGAAIEYTRSSSATLPTIAAQVRIASTTAGQMEPGELVLATSGTFDADFSCNNPTPGIPCRWGDYSGATPDPVHTNVVWGTNMFITASTSLPAWSDENFALLVAIAPHAPTAVSATPNDQSATVSWTPSAFAAGDADTTYTITVYVGVTAGATMTVNAPATTAIFRGLVDGITYTFTVIANNGVGASPPSIHSNPVTPARAPTNTGPLPPLGTRSGATQSAGGTPGPR